MYLFIQDRGKSGCIVAIADSEERARELMSLEINYSKDEELDSYPLHEEMVFVNYGEDSY